MSIEQLVILYNRIIGLKERDITWLSREVSVRNGFCFAGKSYDAEMEKQKGRDRRAIEVKKTHGKSTKLGKSDLDPNTATIEDPESMARVFGGNVYRG